MISATSSSARVSQTASPSSSYPSWAAAAPRLNGPWAGPMGATAGRERATVARSGAGLERRGWGELWSTHY
eukprot:8922589-Pyramimonas_sp.AAC.1